MNIRLLVIVILLSFQGLGFSQAWHQDLKDRTGPELRRFTEVTGMASNFKPLAPASPLGIWGADLGIELTSIPQSAFQVFNTSLNMPSFFPRISVAKGLTPNLDLELSAFIPKLIEFQVSLPQAIKDLWVYGGGLKYTILNEATFPLSLAVRATYTRLYLDFFNSDTFGADVSLSRALSLSFIPFTLTPYIGAGYISINGEFTKKELLNLLEVGTYYAIQDYRYFTGLSAKLFIFDVTGEANFANPKEANTFSLKLSLDI